MAWKHLSRTHPLILATNPGYHCNQQLHMVDMWQKNWPIPKEVNLLCKIGKKIQQNIQTAHRVCNNSFLQTEYRFICEPAQ